MRTHVPRLQVEAIWKYYNGQEATAALGMTSGYVPLQLLEAI